MSNTTGCRAIKSTDRGPTLSSAPPPPGVPPWSRAARNQPSPSRKSRPASARSCGLSSRGARGASKARKLYAAPQSAVAAASAAAPPAAAAAAALAALPAAASAGDPAK